MKAFFILPESTVVEPDVHRQMDFVNDSGVHFQTISFTLVRTVLLVLLFRGLIGIAHVLGTVLLALLFLGVLLSLPTFVSMLLTMRLLTCLDK